MAKISRMTNPTRSLLLLSWIFAVAATSRNNDVGAVSSESKVCSEVGIELLKRGGNAADAMVGTTLCVGVTSMQHSGIGGGGFMLVHGPDGEFESIDFRETAPAAAFKDMYKHNPSASVWSGLASGVPGDVKGLEYLHKKYGALPWKAVVNPAAHIAIHGFRVTEDIVRYMNGAVGYIKRDFFLEDPQWAIDFAPNGTVVGLGDTVTRKRYGRTLKRIGEHGSKAFYEGEIANYTIAAVQAAGGTMTLEDLKTYDVSLRPALNITYNNFTIHSTGAPSGGAVALSILKIMEGYSASSSSSSKDISLNTHRLNEAMRYSYASRSKLGDPAFYKNMDSYEANMILPSTAENIRSQIQDDKTRNISEYGPEIYDMPENHGTSHIVTSDKSGLAITLTTTVNLLFGSLVVVPETGIVMNNEMNDFSIPGTSNEFALPPSPINYIAPLKRPLSSITPLIITHSSNSSLYLIIGAAGGSRIITATAQATWHVLEHGMSVSEALAERRMHDQLLPARTTFELGFNESVVEALREKGHNVTWITGYESAVQGIRRLWDGSWEAGSEPRQRNSGGLVC